MSLSATTDSTISNALGSFSTNFLVGDSNKPMTLEFITPSQMILQTDTIHLTTTTAQSTYLGVGASSISGSSSSCNLTTATQVFTIANITSGMRLSAPSSFSSTNFSSGVGIQFSGGGIRFRSMISSGVKYFTLQLQRSGYSYATVLVPLTVRPNTLNTATFTSLSPFVSQVTTYSFTINIKNPLGAQAAIRITLPSEMSIAVGTCVSTTSTTLSSFTYNQTCTASSSTSILIQNITNAVLTASTIFTVTVAGITNPISTKPTSTPFII